MLLIGSFLATLVAGSLALSASDRADCTDIKANALGYTAASGRYNLLVGDGKRAVWAYCDMTTDGGGWTVFQRRTSAAVDFYRTWKEYESGFGDVNKDYWLGLTYLHSLTINKRYTLRIEMTDWDNIMSYAEYDDFRVGGAGCNYTLDSLGKFCGSCGDSLTQHLGAKFSTMDNDNDSAGSNCAEKHHGAWWYKACHNSNLNGDYKVEGSHTSFADGINWFSCRGYNYSFKTVVMMIRPFFF